MTTPTPLARRSRCQFNDVIVPGMSTEMEPPREAFSYGAAVLLDGASSAAIALAASLKARSRSLIDIPFRYMGKNWVALSTSVTQGRARQQRPR